MFLFYFCGFISSAMIPPSDSLLLKTNGLDYIFIYNDLCYKVVKKDHQNFLILNDTINIAPIKNIETYHYNVLDSCLYFLQYNRGAHIVSKLDLVKGKLNNIYELHGFFGAFHNNSLLFYKDVQETKLYMFDFFRQKEVLVKDFKDLIQPGACFFKVITMPETSKVLVITCIEEMGDAFDFRYFVYDLDKKEIKRITYKQNFDFSIGFNDDYDYNTGKLFLSKYVLDHSFSIVDSVCRSYGNKLGVAIKNDKIYTFYETIIDLKDKFDLNIKALIKRNIDYELEKHYYNIYMNEVLSKNEIELLDFKQLNLIKAMIYAKHGYSFSSDKYYYAYFEMYEFYSTLIYNLKGAKIENVENLLTPNDRVNLKIVESYLQK